MRRYNKKTVWALLGVGLLLVALVPSVAVAGSGSSLMRGPGGAGRFTRSASATGTDFAGRVAEQLRQRIALVLQRRAARFDSVAQQLSTRITKVGGLADKVAAAGGDVSSTRTLLDSAKSHLDSAQSLESQAVAAFRAVPSAVDRRAAFMAARGIGRQAGEELRASRKDLRAAVISLRSVIGALKASTQGATGSN